MEPLHDATLNIRNSADQWDERLPLLFADIAALKPDLLGLQEVVYVLHIWVRGAVGVERCGLALDRPAVGDPTLDPSDHLGLSARLSVG
jgi:hypothetical protein